ncbi:MAG TPA: amidohydrolase family protein [Chloroflexota bacterium]|nr:amidohydrolase family protein [Chloroflexota bacterium]
MSTSQPVLFRSAAVLDPERGELLPDRAVLVDGDRIAEVGGPELKHEDARIVDIGGMTLMPGLIDAHVHVTAVLADLGSLAEASPYYVAARAGEVLRGMLGRGFTTVRDAGGADYGLAAAVDQGYFDGPRVVFGGKALSQTGGHADMRPRGRALLDQHVVSASLGTVCDGVAEVRRAAREELRRGAFHIKIMLSGGVASPTDRVDSTQFSVEEIRAAVEEATAANRYVMGHAYTSRAINRGLECGVRSIEHGNLMDESSIPVFLSHQAFYVPTLVTYSALAEDGRAAGLPEDSYRKVFDVLDAGLRALELADRAGVQIAFGTDLLGPMHAHQSREFTIRAQVQPPDAIIRSATTTAARLLNLEGQVGVVAPGAYADLLVVDGNPLEDIALLAAPEQHLKMIVKSGRFVAV